MKASECTNHHKDFCDCMKAHLREVRKKQRNREKAYRLRKSELRKNNNTNYVNSYNSGIKKSQPFRISDGRMVVGKHKFQLVEELPKDYIDWMVREMDLNSSSLSYLRSKNLI